MSNMCKCGHLKEKHIDDHGVCSKIHCWCMEFDENSPDNNAYTILMTLGLKFLEMDRVKRFEIRKDEVLRAYVIYVHIDKEYDNRWARILPLHDFDMVNFDISEVVMEDFKRDLQKFDEGSQRLQRL